MKKREKMMRLLVSCLMLLAFTSNVWAKEARKDIKKLEGIPLHQNTSKVLTVDLVVSKVKIKRGTFAGAQKIKIIPCVKNADKGYTAKRIKILLSGLALAEWIEDGIGPKEEKCGGSLYVDDPHGNASLYFTVKVDNNNTIHESNELNNNCPNVRFGPSEREKINICYGEGVY